ncbi:MAG: flagellin [Methanospirillum sp.]|uniref:flagellin n=1 Tax=Methanospirillum sp. TaxID=45200 RepID=UPI00236B4320|nr:flagellin [Methanospirillum sp.]MDD1728188.1 flagellin [Methanospirillum sp.]
MSAETFTTAMFLITAVIAAGVLINAVFPVVYQMAGTFSSSTHASDERLRTDFKIITYFANGNTDTAEIWLKNIGSSRILLNDIKKSDVLWGTEGDYGRLMYSEGTSPANGQWVTEFGDSADEISKEYDLNANEYWDSGETLHIKIMSPSAKPFISGDNMYFQFVLPGGTWRSVTFTAR